MPSLRHLLLASTTLAAALTLSGCAHTFSLNYQKVPITSATQDAKITYPTLGIKGKGKVKKFDRRRAYFTVKVEKEGYQTKSHPFQPTKRSPIMALAILNLAVPYYGWFYGLIVDFQSPKTRKILPQEVPALTKYEPRSEDEKFIIVENTAFDTKGEDILWHQYNSLKKYKENIVNDSWTKEYNKSKKKTNFKVDNTIFTKVLNVTMKKMNFIDTTKTIFPAVSNTLFLNSSVKKFTIHNVPSHKVRTSLGLSGLCNELLAIEMEIEWEVLDYYKQKVYTTKTNTTSDFFLIEYGSEDKEQLSTILHDAMINNLETSMLKVRKEVADKGLLKIGEKDEKGLASLPIPRPAKIENGRMNDFMKSGVIINVDEGHGSGFFISSDGYILTAYHVIAGTKKIEVVQHDGTKTVATVVRKNEAADLALLKVELKDVPVLPIAETADPEIGVDVWAIGTPKSVELGQSVSKGVLSAIRKANDVVYLQTDVPLNGGNSGGPLIDKNGQVLGVVTSKLVGIGTEGVGFAISAKEIFERLKIQYQ